MSDKITDAEIVADLDRAIALMENSDEAWACVDAMKAARARLAAAPDMLAALIALEKLATGHAAPVGSMHSWWDDIFNARDAIKKATGA